MLKNQNTDRIFTAEDGFNFAFGIIDVGAEDLVDVAGRQIHEFIEIEALIHTYDYRNGNSILESTSLNPHPCT